MTSRGLPPYIRSSTYKSEKPSKDTDLERGIRWVDGQYVLAKTQRTLLRDIRRQNWYLNSFQRPDLKLLLFSPTPDPIIRGAHVLVELESPLVPIMPYGIPELIRAYSSYTDTPHIVTLYGFQEDQEQFLAELQNRLLALRCR